MGDAMLYWIFVIAAGLVVGMLVLAYLDVIVLGVLGTLAVGIVALLLLPVATSLVQIAVSMIVLLMISVVAHHTWKYRREGRPLNRVQNRSVPYVAGGGHGSTVVGHGELHLVIDDTSRPLDARTTQTIVDALTFYRDNQLAYGSITGQLDAGETTALIVKLTP